ncbi:MAG: hypothetical protein AB8B55_01565 [Mariniblastus sp.]
MSFAPKQNWDSYRLIVEPLQLDVDKKLSPDEKFQRYAALFNQVWAMRPARLVGHAAEISRNEEKMSLRKKLRKAYVLVVEDR